MFQERCIGSFAGIPNPGLNVVLLDPGYHLGVYAAGLVNSAGGDPFFLDTYSAVAPPFPPSPFPFPSPLPPPPPSPPRRATLEKLMLPAPL